MSVRILAVADFTKVDGQYVATATPDGDGGWFIGGVFGSVGGVPRTSRIF
jgi:hypothetical protein